MTHRWRTAKVSFLSRGSDQPSGLRRLRLDDAPISTEVDAPETAPRPLVVPEHDVPWPSAPSRCFEGEVGQVVEPRRAGVVWRVGTETLIGISRFLGDDCTVKEQKRLLRIRVRLEWKCWGRPVCNRRLESDQG